MNKIKYLLLLLFLLSSTLIFSNGMGTYTISAATRSSDPICRDIKDITLLSEKLYIKLTPGWSDVTVKYILWNNSDKDYIDIDYAFPMDYAESGTSSYNNRGEMIKNIFFSLDGQSLPYQHSEDKRLEDKAISWGYFSLLRRWYYTKISVKKHSFATLEVRYSLENLQFCDGASPEYIETTYGGCANRYMLYDFSPASHWGDGIIRDFQVEVDADELYLSGDIPEDYSIKDNMDNEHPLFMVKGLDFVQKGNKFIYKTRNYDLNKTASLYITYSTDHVPTMDMLSQNMLHSNMYTVTASSAQTKYPVSNLIDMNLETAWVSKGVGGWVEFTFKEPIHGLAGYILANGYQKSETTYTQNNRIKVLKMEIKQSGKDWIDSYSGKREFQDEPYTPAYFENLMRHSEYFDFFDSYGYEDAIEKIRFTIEEVYPGTKYDDTCISEIILFKININNDELTTVSP